jgi:cytochrome P450
LLTPCLYSQSERFSPFTFTPRDCMGKNFAQMEMRVILAHLFREFTFALAKPTKDFERSSFLGVNRATLGPRDIGVDPSQPAELGLYVHIAPRR